MTISHSVVWVCSIAFFCKCLYISVTVYCPIMNMCNPNHYKQLNLTNNLIKVLRAVYIVLPEIDVQDNSDSANKHQKHFLSKELSYSTYSTHIGVFTYVA